MATINKTYEYKAHNAIFLYKTRSRVRWWFYGILVFLAITMFLPWTQNIRTKGTVTTLRQEQRPQEVNSIIPGRVVKWYVKEGDFVNAGDTILQLSEIKDDYLDPNLLNRTKEQLSAKQIAIDYYQNKAGTAGQQMGALSSGRGLKQEQLINKLQQLRLKLQSDSAEVIAANNDFKIASTQYNRQRQMYDSGLVSLTQLEQRNQVYQNALAKKIMAENKLANTRQDLTINQIEMNSVEQEYAEKISKAQGDQFQSLSQIATGQGDIAKLQNQFSNYNIRSGLYYIWHRRAARLPRPKKRALAKY
jgi:multidrug efflux pump subunit AcrA (membrane-fusion protein)